MSLLAKKFIFNNTIFLTCVAPETFDFNFNFDLVVVIIVLILEVIEIGRLDSFQSCVFFKLESLSGEFDPGFETNFEIHDSQEWIHTLLFVNN